MTVEPAVRPPQVARTRPVAEAGRRTTGRPARAARWAPGGLALVVAAAGVLYGWRLDAVGWMNQYYASVAQAGSLSWRALLFASPDPTAVTSTDKPPLAFWPMALSARLFGLHPWSVALPQVLETLVTLVLLYLTVRALAGRVAGLVAAAVLATTPVVVVLARFDDPDTLLTMLVTGAAYLTVRAARSRRRRWLVALGLVLGLAFLTKWLIAFVVVPAFAATVLRPALPGGSATRQHRAWGAVGLVAAVTCAVGLGWVGVLLATPAARRPYPDSPTGNILGLVLGQNGFSRLVPAGTVGTSPINGAPGPLRLFGAPFVGQVGWLLPAAALALVLAAAHPRAPGRRRLADGYVLFGGWLLLAGGLFSAMGGSMHPYYTDLLAPALAGLVGLGVADLRAARLVGRGGWPTRSAVLVGLVLLGGFASLVLRPYPSLRGWGRLVLAGVVLADVLLLTSWLMPSRVRWRAAGPWLAGAAAGVALLLGPAAFAASTLSHPVLGADPLAGPIETGSGHAPYSAALVAFLRGHDAPLARWAAAVVTSTPASELQLQLGRPVLPVGGFTGHAGFPSVAELQGWVASRRLRYIVLAGPYVAGSGATPPGLAGTTTASVMGWALSHGCRVTVPGARYAVLDLAPGAPCATPAPPSPGHQPAAG